MTKWLTRKKPKILSHAGVDPREYADQCNDSEDELNHLITGQVVSPSRVKRAADTVINLTTIKVVAN